ncbi:MAG: winged helix-turn-helix transcriptional regulator [Thaumarchaeota archaeon]|nr:winged helix-turn-helix transcriptional regulator [Nitrososphaerota archaeon]
MESNEKKFDPAELKEKIEILSTDDDRIKAVGEILSNDSSRKILKILLDDTMTANQIAQKAAISLPLTIYHLKKMQDIGILSVTATENDSKYYTSSKFAFVITSARVSEKARSSKSLFNSLKRIYKFAAIGFSGLVSWLVLQSMNPAQNPEYSSMKTPVPSTTTTAPAAQSQANTLAPTMPVPAHVPVTLPPYMSPVEPSVLSHDVLIFVIPLVVIITGLIIERIFSAYKR